MSIRISKIKLSRVRNKRGKRKELGGKGRRREGGKGKGRGAEEKGTR